MSVRNALLGLLAQRQRHGYELHAAFEAMMGGKANWEVKPAQIYTTLSRLENGGFIEKSGTVKQGGPEKLVYSITEKGKEDLRAWLDKPVDPGHTRDEFFLKLMVCLASEQSDPYEIIYSQRISLYKKMHVARRRKQDANPDKELAQILLLERAAMHMEADLRWLDMIESRLDEIRKQPVAKPELRPRGRPPQKNQGPK
jgi:DNA-binding PadR family transcriptional regulator